MLKYEKIAHSIEEYIYINDLPQGTKLPTVETLAEKFKVSKSTIIKALESLVLKSLVYQVQGSGIFVRRKNRDGYLNLNYTKGFTDTLKDYSISSMILDFSIIHPDEEIANWIECSTDDELYYIKRVKYVNEKVLCIEESHYKKSIVPYLTKEIAEGSIFEYLKSGLNLNIGFSDRYLHISKLSCYEANLLNLKQNDPAMVVFEQIYLSSGVSFNFSKLTYNYQNSQFFIQTT